MSTPAPPLHDSRRPSVAGSLGLSLAALLFTTSCLTTPSAESGALTADPGARYKNASAAASGADLLPAGDWWTAFGDRDLNRLMRQLESDNPSLDAALARYDRARGALGLARSDRFPSVTGDAFGIRRRDTASGIFVPDTLSYSQYRAALNLDYEIDLWGRVRRNIAAAAAEFEASAADYAGAELSLKAELARTWFQYFATLEEIRLLEETVDLREDNQRLIDARVRGGESNRLDLERAKTETESTRAILIQLQRQASADEHALAFLVGTTPKAFSAPEPGSKLPSARIPAGVPSETLARRPDIAAAEARVRAAGEQLGIVKASYLPRVTLRGTGGFSSLDLSTWFNADSVFGEIGPSVTFPIFQGGRFFSDELQAKAASREALAAYEETVLGAFREVETALSDLSHFDREIQAHRRAAESGIAAAALSRKRYVGGLVSYLEVIDAERTSLDQQRLLTKSRAARQLATVRLIQALGGGWKKP